MREVVSRSQLSPILSRDRGIISQEVKDLIQQTLDEYGSGVNIVRVNFDKADPPQQVIDAFREVQAARQERSTLQNRPTPTPTRRWPRRAATRRRRCRRPRATAPRWSTPPQGEASRFTAVQQEYVKAPEVTRKRLYLETMEDVLGNVQMFLVDTPSGNGQRHRALPAAQRAARRAPPAPGRDDAEEPSDAPPSHPDRRRRRRWASCC